MSLRDGIIDTIYLTFAHNQYAIGFFLGAVVSLGLLIYKPSRFATLLLIGFTTLLLNFEYNKHILEPLEAQTSASLGLSEAENSAKLLLSRSLQKLVPIGMFAVGWGSIFIAILIKGLKREAQD
jgi:predicted alpha/beta superfamily hydrolase